MAGYHQSQITGKSAIDGEGAVQPDENWQQMQGMILHLLQEPMQAKSREMEAHGTLFSRQQDLVKQLAKTKMAVDRSCKGYLEWLTMPHMVKEDIPEAYLETFGWFVTQVSWDVSQWATLLELLLMGWTQASYCTFTRTLTCTLTLTVGTTRLSRRPCCINWKNHQNITDNNSK